jgi:hypothetical protein
MLAMPEFTLDDEPVQTPASDVDSIADDIVNELPEPSQNAIDQAARESGGGAEGTVDVDALGVPWNPQYHATGSDGKGIKTARGNWRKRRGVSGSAPVLNTSGTGKSDGAGDGGATAEPADTPTGPSAKEIAARQGGVMASRLLVRFSVGLGGTDFLPAVLTGPGGVSINEQEMLDGAFADYFAAKGWEDLPPGWALFGALSMYYLPRLQMPKTKERAKGAFGWIRDKYQAWRFRRGEKRAGKANGSTRPEPADGGGEQLQAG